MKGVPWVDYEQILKGCGEVGCRLLRSGAEIYRVEDTVRRMLAAYGVQADVFAIPTTLIVSITDEEGHNHTRLYRTEAAGGTDIEAVERYNALSRAVCAQPPEPAELMSLAEQTGESCRTFSRFMILMGYFLGALFFTLFFRGGLLEGIAAGIAAVFAGICVQGLDRQKVNFFFKTTAAALVLGIVAYSLCALGLPVNMDTVVIGAIMVLVPGIAFTNFMCDLMAGDALSGVSTFIRAVLTATAIAIGTGAALYLFRSMGFDTDGTALLVEYGALAQCVIGFLACAGFCLLYNVHGGGAVLCCLGGTLGWGVYLAVSAVSDSIYISYVAAAMFISAYAETMARVRKYPITAYLVVSYFPLVPGSYIYYAMYYSIQGELALAADKGVQAIGLAACLAIGVLLVSTAVRTVSAWRKERREAR